MQETVQKRNRFEFRARLVRDHRGVGRHKSWYGRQERIGNERIGRSFKPGKRSQERRMDITKWKKLAWLMLVGVFCVSALGASAFADDDGKGQPPAKASAAAKIESSAPLTERERQLLDRVEQLEKRMAELEAKAQHTPGVPTPTSAIPDSLPGSVG